MSNNEEKQELKIKFAAGRILHFKPVAVVADFENIIVKLKINYGNERNFKYSRARPIGYRCG